MTLSDQTVKLAINSDPSHLPVVRAAVEKVCEIIGFDSKTVGDVILGVDEALANIIKHAYRNQHDQPIEIELTPMHDHDGSIELLIRLKDNGMMVDPSTIKGRDLDDIRPGGLGVHIMKHCMDQLEYQPAPGGGTILTMTKRLPEKRKETQ